MDDKGSICICMCMCLVFGRLRCPTRQGLAAKHLSDALAKPNPSNALIGRRSPMSISLAVMLPPAPSFFIFVAYSGVWGAGPRCGFYPFSVEMRHDVLCVGNAVVLHHVAICRP